MGSGGASLSSGHQDFEVCSVRPPSNPFKPSEAEKNKTELCIPGCGEGEEAFLVTGVRGVGDQLTEEDVLAGGALASRTSQARLLVQSRMR